MKRLGRVLTAGMLATVLLGLAGCHSTDPNPQIRFMLPEEIKATSTNRMFSSLLQPGDTIIITFSDMEHPPPQIAVSIPEEGPITLPYDVHVDAVGKSVTQLEKDIRDSYVPAIFVKLTASIKTEQRSFYVDGEVKQPGRQQYIGVMTVLRAIGTSGGFSEFANRKNIEVRRGGQRIMVNYYKALEHPNYDIPILPNDHIIVKRTVLPW